VTLFLVEQNAHLALKTAHRGYVMDGGQIILANTATKLAEDPAVKAAYLGDL
jgi:branched-chain amino acid transport system ATP-binding protein